MLLYMRPDIVCRKVLLSWKGTLWDLTKQLPWQQFYWVGLIAIINQ